MATLLLMIIYIIFIGLGIPDSIFGTAWPAIYADFNLPISLAGYISMSVSICTVVSSIFSAGLINKFGTGLITAVSTLLTVVALFGFSVSQNVIFLFAFAIPLGLGAGAIDSGLNNYVAINYKATHMNFLHCFYGIGVSLSPYIMSFALSMNNNWRLGYRIVFVIQFVIFVIALFSLPLWQKSVSEESKTEPKRLSFAEAVRMPKLWVVWLVFISSCSVEYISGLWGSTFLVNSKGMSANGAAKITTFYYIGMTLGRFCSGLLSMKFTSRQIIKFGNAVVFTAVAALFLPAEAWVSGICLFFIGFGNGPLFPNMLHLTPQNFSVEISQSVMGLQMAAAYIGIMLVPALFGGVAQKVGTDIFPIFLIVMCTVMVASTYILNYMVKKR